MNPRRLQYQCGRYGRSGQLGSLFGRLLLLVLSSLLFTEVQAVTYANVSQPFNWIDAATHTKVGYNTNPYKFNALSGCGTTPPIIDDTISDAIPIGFNFAYAGVNFSSLRIMMNGRVQFNNNVTCGFGSPVQQLPYPNAGLNYTMRIYGNDLDATLKSDVPGGYNTVCIDRAVCYVSYATIGTAPSRSFVVTWSNVPEYTNGANPVGAYNLQLILQENGEFIYQYGTATPGPSASLGQVGWQVDTNDFDTPQVGFPVNNSAIKFFIPRPVAEYRMEQPSWSSAAGQVIDSSGNARHGTVLSSAALSGPQTISNGRVCRGGNFPSNTNTNKIDAIDTNIAIPTTVGSAGTITFWYKANTAWSGASVQDAQLLDATIVNNQWFFLTRLSNGHLRFVITDSGGTVRTAETGAISVAANTFKHIAVSWSFNQLAAGNSDHLRIYVDGVLQIDSTFTTSNVISSQIGTLYIGDNRSSFTGSSGTGRSADAVLDEFRIYNYEGGLALVQRDFNAAQGGCLSHYAISHSGSGLTCQQSTITITAHDLLHGNIIMPNNTTSIQLSTSTGKGDWTLISGYGVLDNGTADDGIATYLFNGEFQAVFGLNHTTAGTVNINVTDGQFVESEDPLLIVAPCSVGRFNACEVSTPRCVPTPLLTTYARLNTKLANTAFALDMVKLQSTGILETTFNGSVTVDLLANTTSVALNPNTNCPVSQSDTIALGSVNFSNGYGTLGGVTVAANAFSSGAKKYSAYRDVRVRFTCSTGVCGSAITACSTDNFSVRPTALTLSSGASFPLKAGTQFDLTATAVPGYNGLPLIDNSLNGRKIVTHLGNSDYTGRLVLATPVSPIPLGTAAESTGSVSNGTLVYDDVGSFGILANGMTDAGFTSVDQPGDCIIGSASNTAILGKFGCNIANTGNTALVGRFYPDHYDVKASLGTACNGFTYMGQSGLDIAIGATAFSKNGVILSHYTGNYAPQAVMSFNAGNNVNPFNALDTRLSPGLPGFAWNAGQYGRYQTTDGSAYAAGSILINVQGIGPVPTGASVRFVGDPNIYTVVTGVTDSGPLTIAAPGLVQSLPATPTVMAVVHTFTRLGNPDGPYDAFALNLNIADPDGAQVTTLNGSNFGPQNAVMFGSAKLRYGRLSISNAYGSDRLALPVTMRAQYWSGNGYFTNTLDNCTVLQRSSFAIDGHLRGLLPGHISALGNIPATSGSLTGGAGIIRLTPPVTPPAVLTPGSFNLRSTIPFLPGMGRETLGIHKNGPTLYIREIY